MGFGPRWRRKWHRRWHNDDDDGEASRRKATAILVGLMVALALGLPHMVGAALEETAVLPAIAAIVVGVALYRRFARASEKTREEGYEEDEARERPQERVEASAQAERARQLTPAGRASLVRTLVGFASAAAIAFGIGGLAQVLGSGSIANAVEDLVLSAALGLLGLGGVAWATVGAWKAKAATRGEAELLDCVRRIQRKCGRLQREARKIGSVYKDLRWQAPDLGREAARLGRLIIRMRRAARDTQRNAVQPLRDLAEGNATDGDPRLQAELQAAQETQGRLDGLLRENARRQQLCLAQIERIEGLVDAARLELANPLPTRTAASMRPPIVDEVEGGLTAAREALQQFEVQ